MANFGFGEELAEARRRGNYTVQQVSDALRIRPDIIRAIEMEDFARMPAKGFSRNQVSAYARFLGLNPVEYTQKFMSAYDDFEHKASRIGYVTDYQQPTNDRAYDTMRRNLRMQEEMAAKPHSKIARDRNRSRNSKNGGRNGGRDRQGEDRNERNRSRSSANAGSRRRPGGSGGSRCNGRDGSDQRDYGRAGAARGGSRGGASQQRRRGQAPSDPRRRQQDDRRNNSRGRYATPRGSGHRRGAGDKDIGSKGFNPGGSRFPIRRLAILLIAIIVIVIIAVGVANGRSGSSELDAQATSNTVQGTGGTSAEETGTTTGTAATATTSENTAAMPTNVDAAAITATPDVKSTATSFTLEVDVADGSSSYLSVSGDNGTEVDKTVKGPQQYNLKVTNEAKVTIGNLDAVTVKLNGSPVTVKAGSNGIATATFTLKDGKVEQS